MTADPTITYTPLPPAAPTHNLSGRTNSQLLGYYKAEFANGVRVILPHWGVVGTVSSFPLDLSDDYERSLLRQRATDIAERFNA